MDNRQMNRDKVSIIIQGPFDNTILSHLNNYSKYSNDIIISCYNNDSVPQIDLPDVTIIKSPIPTMKCNPANIGYQAYSTYKGLSIAKNKFSIKTRCDEYFSNLDPLIDKVINNPNKYISSNIGFTKLNNNDQTKWFHVSDHLFGSKTTQLKYMCENVLSVLSYCEDQLSLNRFQNFPAKQISGWQIEECAPEQLFFIYFCYLQYSLYDHCGIYNDDHVRFITKKYADVVDIDNLQPYIWCSHNKNGEAHKFSNKSGWVDYINNMEEL